MPRQNISSTIRVKRLRVRFMMNASADDRIPFPNHSPRRVFTSRRTHRCQLRAEQAAHDFLQWCCMVLPNAQAWTDEGAI